jgi:hypothetical protein
MGDGVDVALVRKALDMLEQAGKAAFRDWCVGLSKKERLGLQQSLLGLLVTLDDPEKLDYVTALAHLSLIWKCPIDEVELRLAHATALVPGVDWRQVYFKIVIEQLGDG